MKILYVSPFPPAQDGIGTYTQALAMAVRNDGYDICVVTPRQVPNTLGQVVGTIASGRWRCTHPDETVGKCHPDVVHVQFAVATYGARTPTLMRWLSMMRRDLAAPLVVTMHEVSRDIALLGGIGQLLYRTLADRCDAIIVHTEEAYGLLIEKVGVPRSKVCVIPHPSARPPLAISTPEEVRTRFGLSSERILLAFGFIHVDKGLDDLIRALSILKRSAAVSLEDVRLVVAGAVRPRHGVFRIFEARDRIHFKRVVRYAKREELDRNLVWTGYVPDSDIAGWFKAAEAVVLPYKRTDQSGVAGLANAFGVPVLASMVGGLKEQFIGSRWSFPPRNPIFLARVIADFLVACPGERYLIPGSDSTVDIETVAAATLDVYHAVARDVPEGLSNAL